MEINSISSGFAKKSLFCNCREWPVYKDDKIALRKPTGKNTRTHCCSKIEVYRKYMAMDRVYVVKGELADKILKNAPNQKKQESEVKEAQEYIPQQEAEVESKS